MAEAQLQQFREKVRQLNAFLALCDSDPELLETLRACDHHDQVVTLASRLGFEIARRWGETAPAATAASLAQDSSRPGPAPAHGAADPAAAVPAAASSGTANDSEASDLTAVHSLFNGARAGLAKPQPCPASGKEHTEVLLDQPQLRLERIHSCSASSPEGFWYDQQEHEWVLLLQGSARLQLASEATERQLHCGDSLYIPARCRHRVNGTDPSPGTVWLALFWRDR